ncbi:unnamed protein product [Peniophora sp. CBMAI 1063]|nr:unnamed protein product [Peniophora sp. CBMAI 1063]
MAGVGTGFIPCNSLSGLPPRTGRTLAIGGAAVLSLLIGSFYGHSWNHKRKESLDFIRPGYISSWENRMKQGYSADPETLYDTTPVGMLEDQRKMSNPAIPRENNKLQHRTLKNATLLEHRRAENGAYRIPYPQRDRGDGLAYTKRMDGIVPMTGNVAKSMKD